MGGLGRQSRKKKEDWQQLLAQVPILKKKKLTTVGERFIGTGSSGDNNLSLLSAPLFALHFHPGNTTHQEERRESTGVGDRGREGI